MSKKGHLNITLSASLLGAITLISGCSTDGSSHTSVGYNVYSSWGYPYYGPGWGYYPPYHGHPDRPDKPGRPSKPIKPDKPIEVPGKPSKPIAPTRPKPPANIGRPVTRPSPRPISRPAMRVPRARAR